MRSSCETTLTSCSRASFKSRQRLYFVAESVRIFLEVLVAVNGKKLRILSGSDSISCLGPSGTSYRLAIFAVFHRELLLHLA